jgi:uncharacterized protein (DUF305 family)
LITRSSFRLLLGSTALVAASLAGSAAHAQQPPIVQPGAPGAAPRTLTPQEAVRVANTGFTLEDVRFMQDMIWHHHQAVEMAALVRERTNNQVVLDAARRIDASQADEIRFMQTWLRERGQEAPDPLGAGGHAQHGSAAGDHHNMPGMATHAQMQALAAARGVEFDRQFLRLMIAHHEGAVQMARRLLSTPNSASDPMLFDFANEVINEQQAEINRMTTALAGLIDDPRSSLAAGVRDAGQAARNMQLLASLPKPTGFFDPANPAGLPQVPGAPEAKEAEQPRRTPDNRPPSFGRAFGFAFTDMAFSKDLLAVGSYHGFNLYRLPRTGVPQLVSSVVCPGGQGDVSVVGNLLIMSVEETRGRVDCGIQGVRGDASAERFRGLRIFDISNPTRPVQVGQVQTCRGSHTHSVVSADAETIIVYNSGTSQVRPTEELARCVGLAADTRTALFSIDVIEIPVRNPGQARLVDSPRVFETDGRIAGLWLGGRVAPGGQETSRTDQCHDITVFPARQLAAGACSGNGIILDISNPRQPRRIDAASDPNFAYWHSATFNNDGTKVLFTDEWGGGSQPRCRAQDPTTWGANAIYDIVDGRLQFRSHYKLPAAQSPLENCVAHNGSIVPVPGRDIFVQAWYQGGISVIDFTDSANPVEIAYFDRGPIDGKNMVLGGYWSAYWYGGRIYGTEIVRGLDILALQPSEYLSANEIAAAALASQGERFNPQQQYPVAWPHDPVIARAFIDQLQRGRAISAGTVAELEQALTQAGTRLTGRRRDRQLATRLETLAGQITITADDAASQKRAESLRNTLRGIAGRLR